MTDFQFIHLADVHLDSPLANLKRLDEATALRLQQATRASLESAMELALQQEVAAVIIAGDLFDGPVKDATAGLWVENLFKRVARAGIQIALIRGNHDSISNACKVSEWPTGVHQFAANQAESLVLDSVGLAMHGQSFGARAETQDLAAHYPVPQDGMFNLGLLHTSLQSPGAHDTYAPTTIQTLEGKGYDYWALGHIHVRSTESLSEKCYVGYSGNTQGRHIREPGAKGCQLVTVTDGKLASIEFMPTDSLRWEELKVDISDVEHLRDIEDLVADSATPAIENAEGRPLAIRVRLTGSTSLHAELTRAGAVDRVAETVGRRLREMGDCWVETIKIATGPFLEQSATEVLLPLKYLSRVSDQCRQDKHSRDELQEVLEELLKKARRDLSDYGFALATGEQPEEELNRYIRRAEDMLVARLMGGQQ